MRGGLSIRTEGREIEYHPPTWFPSELQWKKDSGWGREISILRVSPLTVSESALCSVAPKGGWMELCLPVTVPQECPRGPNTQRTEEQEDVRLVTQ